MTVRALTVAPGVAGSARIDDDLSEPRHDEHTLEVETLLVGLCGTDREIVAGSYGEPPLGTERLVLGHEAVGRVIRAPAGSGFEPGEIVVPVVRRPDPVPCPSCGAGEWDMCENGLYIEHGIKGADGFARARFDLEPRFAVSAPTSLADLAVLVEPASIVAKAWEQIERIGARVYWDPRIVLVTGAGPIGLLAALMARQRGFETHVLDRVHEGPKPTLVVDLGATYHTDRMQEACPSPDITIECTGVGSVVLDAIEHSSRSGIVCLAGLSSGGGQKIELDAAALNRRMVLENDVVFGTVNANGRHYEAALRSLTTADPTWVRRLISRRVRLDDWADAFDKQPDDVKVVLDLAS